MIKQIQKKNTNNISKNMKIQQNEKYEPDYTQLDESIHQPVYIENEKKDIFSETVSNTF